MAWNILPKANLQYFLTKLKNKFLMLTNYNKLGAKNILPFPYAYGSGTVHDLTVTVNDDGSITANGQPTQNVSFTLVSNIITEYGLQVGDKLIFSESNVENNNASAALVYVNPSGPIDLVQGDYELTVTSDMVTKGVAFILWFHSGVDLSTAVTFKPMLRLDTDPDPTWASPAFTNRKLTELVVYLSRNKSHVSANPSSTTGTLTSIEIDGTGYSFPGSSSVTGVKGSAEQNYRTGDVNLSASDVSALGFSQRTDISTLDDFVSLLNLSAGLGFSGRIKINADIGVGVTGWCRVIALSQNAPNNQQYALGMFCIFFPADSSNIRWALIDGHTTGSYTVTGTGILPYTDHTYNFSGTNFHSGNGSSEEHNCNNMTENGLYYYTSNGPSSLGEQSTDGAVMVMAHSASWLTQLAQDYRTGKIYVRSRKNGAWQSWIRVDYSDGMRYTGTATDCFTVYQGDGSFMGRSGWASYLISNHGNGATYYSQTIALPFWGPPIYRRLEGGSDKGWKEFITTENIGSHANKTEFTTTTTNFAMSIAAYSDQVARVNAGPPSGYTTLAVIGVYTGMTTVFALRWGIESGNTARIDLHNTHNAAVSGTASVTFLCYKNST